MNVELSPSLQFLPSPRSISVSIHTDEFRPHDHLMVISAIWGEFVHHDVSHTPQGWKADFAPSKHPNNLGSGLRDPACSRNFIPTIFLLECVRDSQTLSRLDGRLPRPEAQVLRGRVRGLPPRVLPYQDSQERPLLRQARPAMPGVCQVGRRVLTGSFSRMDGS